MIKYFITGGTGFIGRRLVDQILKNGNQATLYVRENSDIGEFENRSNVIIKKGTLLDKENIIEAMKGAHCVLHLAGYAKNWAKDDSVYYDINVQGSINIAEAALVNKVKKLVHTSSIVAFGPTGAKIQNENYIPEEKICFTTYEKTKAEAEKLLIEISKKGMDIVIINPTRVYGPGLISEANSLTLMIQNYLKWRVYLLLGAGKSIANYVFVDDIVNGILLAAEKGISGEKYILGGENSSLKGFFQKLAEVSGKKGIPIVVPLHIAMFIGFTQEQLAKRFGQYPFITRSWIKHFDADWIYSCDKAIKELGYKPHSLSEGLKITIEWLRSRK